MRFPHVRRRMIATSVRIEQSARSGVSQLRFGIRDWVLSHWVELGNHYGEV